MSEVKVIRLTTGEDIIAKIQSQTSDHTEMDKAVCHHTKLKRHQVNQYN
jgi:hypothetical protein